MLLVVIRGEVMLLGKRIKSLRKQKGMTQEELGKLINVTKVSICCYEKETRFPTIETLLALADVFQVDINYLLSSDEYLVADSDTKYGISVAKEELEFIKEIRKNSSLYERMIDDPKRFVELMDRKMR